MRYIHSDESQRTLLIGIFLLNLLDMVFTIVMIREGFAAEANPIMLSLMEKSELHFSVIKTFLVTLCCILLWQLREHKVARIATVFCFSVYFLLLCYHILGITASIQLALDGYM